MKDKINIYLLKSQPSIIPMLKIFIMHYVRSIEINLKYVI